jgi:hypothetical protein
MKRKKKFFFHKETEVNRERESERGRKIDR